MFGYVVANKPELKVKEWELYNGYYCGLCQTLKKRHGLFGQLTLSYDMTFLVILLSSLYEADKNCNTHRCLVHGCKKKPTVTSEYAEYVSDMNVILAYYKALDDWQDEKSISKLTYSKLIKKSIKKYPDKSKAIKSLLSKLTALENSNTTNIDEVAGVFGNIMSEIIVIKDDMWSDHLKRLGFFLGKFIYILDAYDDLEKDIKKNNYNPFKSICNDDDFDDKIKRMLTLMMTEVTAEFEYLPIIEDADLLRNILYSGVWSKFNEKLNLKKNKEVKND